MRLLIESDGTMLGTHVTNEQGEHVGLIQKIVWELSNDDIISKCVMEFAMMSIRAEVDATIIKVDAVKPAPQTDVVVQETTTTFVATETA